MEFLNELTSFIEIKMFIKIGILFLLIGSFVMFFFGTNPKSKYSTFYNVIGSIVVGIGAAFVFIVEFI